jgi:hypothetical protein
MEFHRFDDPVRELSLGMAVDVLDQGSHEPLLCRLEELDGTDAGEWVVKTASMYTHGATSLLREFVGSDLAAMFGLLTPSVALLRLPASPMPTDDTRVGQRARAVFAADAGGIAFCSRKLDAPPLDPGVLTRPGRRARTLIRDAIDLACFDGAFWHHDRTTKNPNVLLLGQRLVAIDHDRICHGIEAVDETGLSPDYSRTEIAGHVLTRFLRPFSEHEEWTAAAERVRSAGDRIDFMLARWPDELDRNKNGATVGLKGDLKRFLVKRIEHAAEIVEEVRRGTA